MNSFEFEICANSLESCLAAQVAGATRVELCAGIPEGGTTPSYAEISFARKMLHTTKLHVIIRPRGGDFTYSPLEIERMGLDITMCKEIGVDGVVFGCLTADGDIDVENCVKLLRHAGGLSCTFHRAYDRCKSPLEALPKLKELGFDRVLTSGQASTAEAGIALLKQIQAADVEKPIIMAGCGVNEGNIAKIHAATGITAFHFSAREPQQSATAYMHGGVAMGKPDADESTLQYTTERRVAARRDHPLAQKQAITPADLYKEPLILSRQLLQNHVFNHWLSCDTSDLSIRSTCNLAYNVAFLAEQRLGLMLSFAGIVATDEAHHPELTFRPLQPALYSHNYLIWKEGQIFSRAAGVVRARLDEIFGTRE